MSWKRCTAERYEEMLGVLPPRTMTGLGFLVGEPSSHRRCTVSGQVLPDWAAFVQLGGNYYEGPCLTLPEWRNLDADAIKGAAHGQG